MSDAEPNDDASKWLVLIVGYVVIFIAVFFIGAMIGRVMSSTFPVAIAIALLVTPLIVAQLVTGWSLSIHSLASQEKNPIRYWLGIAWQTVAVGWIVWSSL